MKVRKLRRRTRVFRRRNWGQVFVKALLWLLIIPAAIGGYYLAQHLTSLPQNKPASTSPTTLANGANGETGTTTVQESPPSQPQQNDSDSSSAFADLQAIYLPTTALNNLEAWAPTLTAAKAAGYNAVVFDLKDENGRVWYQSASELAVQARAVNEKALTADALKSASQTLQSDYGMTAVPRLFAFRDHQAPRYLPTARVSVQGNPSSVWYDNAPASGGRRWLNPYSADARRYITELAAEVKSLGFSLLILDGVQFPAQESSAYYGTKEETATPRNEVLAQFVSEMNEAVGQNGWMLSMTALSSVGEQTTVYGGNPVTYGAAAVSPWLLPDELPSRLVLGDEKVSSAPSHPYEAASLIFRQLQARLRLMETAPPVPVPWIAADSASDIVRALHEVYGENAPYILYQEDGRYAFG